MEYCMRNYYVYERIINTLEYNYEYNIYHTNDEIIIMIERDY